MNSTLPVIAGVDGSPNSLRALDWAAEAARLAGARLHVVHVWPITPMPRALGDAKPHPTPDPADPVLREVQERFAGRADVPETRYLSAHGASTSTLIRLSAQARLLVLGSRGRGGFTSLLLGSAGRAAAMRAACPVVVVPDERRIDPGAGAQGRVVLGLHPEETSDEAVDHAFAVAERRAAELRVVTAYPSPYPLLIDPESLPPGHRTDAELAAHAAARQDERLRPFTERHYPGVTVDQVVAPGDVAGRLVAASRAADLVVVGRHRRRLREGGLMGSVANAVLLHGHCPTAVIPVR
ncbi:universal stress protein [Streptomyces olivaceiscleroticus]|uniref:Universal stress protein n=1 Tax=Streptomyces olivaceiscleroticus TaxID=68245 RepID=A0ABP3JN65_9ACTN